MNPITIIIYLRHIYSIRSFLPSFLKIWNKQDFANEKQKRQVVEDNSWCSLSLPLNYTDLPQFLSHLLLNRKTILLIENQKKILYSWTIMILKTPPWNIFT